jgi:hypothetical protein
MRIALVGTVILVLTAGATIRAQDQPSPLDVPTTLRLPSSLPMCGVDTVLLALARTSHVAIGFEESYDESTVCSGRFARVSVTHVNDEQPPMTVRQVLDQLVTLAPEYQWAEMDGIAVIRPVAAWIEPANVLNGRMAPLHVANATVGDTLAILLRTPMPGDSAPPGFGHVNFHKPPFAIAFNGGTMVEALNVLVRSEGDAGWRARVLHASGVDGTPALQIAVTTWNVGDPTLVDGTVSVGAPLSRLVVVR